MKRQTHIGDGEIASYADGSLPQDRRREIEDEIHRSETAREAIAQQQRAVDIVRGAEVAAPPELHAAVSELAAPRAPHRARRGAALVAGLAAAAVVAVALATSGGPSQVDRAAQLAAAGPNAPAPKENPSNDHWLKYAVDDVAFPYWENDQGFKSYGARQDSFDGRAAKTVYYRDGAGRSVAYTIVGGKPIKGEGTRHGKGDIVYWSSSRNGTRRVVWWRGGHTCILTARDVGADELQALVD